MGKIHHGKYVYENAGNLFILSTHLRKGRAFLSDGRVKDVNFKDHPKICKRVVTKGEYCPDSLSHKKEYV